MSEGNLIPRQVEGEPDCCEAVLFHLVVLVLMLNLLSCATVLLICPDMS